MLCPLMKQDCRKDGCMWFTNKSCAVVNISDSLFSLDMSIGGEDQSAPLSLIVDNVQSMEEPIEKMKEFPSLMREIINAIAELK